MNSSIHIPDWETIDPWYVGLSYALLGLTSQAGCSLFGKATPTGDLRPGCSRNQPLL